MVDKVTEIRSGIDEIRLTSKFLLKRLNKVIDDGNTECTCNCNTEPIDKDIEKLQSRINTIEDRLKTRDESHLCNDLKVLVDRFEMVERKFQDETGNLKLLQNGPTVSATSKSKSKTKSEPYDKDKTAEQKHDDTNRKTILINVDEGDPLTAGPKSQVLHKHTNDFKSKSAPPEGDTAFNRIPTEEKNDATKTKEKQKLNDDKKLKENSLRNMENRSELFNNRSNAGERNKEIRKSNVPLKKPNFMVPKQSVRLIKQEKGLVFDSERHWRSMAQHELDTYRNRYLLLEDVHSVICLDISESMADSDGWTDARTFITDYLTGLKDMSKSYSRDLYTEHVALITFGHQTKIQVGYTADYRDIEKELDDTKLGGPTQMYGGCLIALAAARCSRHQVQRLDNCSKIFTKIIFVTDGRPTEDDLLAGPDIADSSKIDDTKAKILQEMERLRKDHEDLFFVPVGNSDVDFHKTMAAISDGTVLDCRQGRRLARRQYLTTRLVDPLGLIAGTQTRGSDYDLSSEDKEDLMNIQESAKRHYDANVRISNSPDRDAYHESKSKTLPPIGSRVRKGPDWHPKQHDSNGPGTVIGQVDNDQQLWVEWDADEYQNIYMYGALGYEVLIVDEPRKLKPGEKIAVGCEVVPGKDWKNTDGNVNLGVVIKVKRHKKKAKVRWNNGKRGSYMYDDIQQIQVKTETDSSGASNRFSERSPKQEFEFETPPAMTIEEFAAKQEKKKNKNSN